MKKKRVIHNRNETNLHLISKVLLSKMLMQKNHKVAMEYQLTKRKPDIIDDTTKVVYEIENNPDKSYMKEFEIWADEFNANAQMIPLNKIPKQLRKELEISLKQLTKWLEIYMI